MRENLPFTQQTDHHSKSSRFTQQAAVSKRADEDGLWTDFKDYLRDEYGMDPKWVDSRAGSIKPVINQLTNLKTFVEKVQQASEDDIYVQNMLRDMHSNLINTLVSTAERNELKISEGCFRNFIALEIPDLDPRRAQLDSELPPPENDELQEEKEKLAAWLQ